MPDQQFHYPEQYYNTQSAEQVLPILFALYEPKSLLDVGCGNGSWMVTAQKLGITDLMGIDSQGLEHDKWPLAKEQFNLIELDRPFNLQRKFDMVLCLEVAEHLPVESASTLISNLVKHSDLIVFSAAIPGQEGDRHINNREPSYWQQLFNQHGFNTYDNIRPIIWENQKIFWWYRQNIFIAKRSGFVDEKVTEKIKHIVHPEHFIEMTDTTENYKRGMAYFENSLIEHQQRDQSILYHLKRIIKLIIFRK